MTDHYTTLGIPKDASAADIKKAFKRRASKAHPDKGGDGKEMAEVNRAYACLGDEQRRIEYDRTGNDGPGKTDTERAEELLADLFSKIIENSTDENPLTQARRELSTHINSLHQRKAHTATRIKRLAAQRKRVKAKKGANLFQALIDAKVSQAEAVAADLASGIVLYTLVQKLLEDYEADDPPAPKPTVGRPEGMFNQQSAGAASLYEAMFGRQR